MRLLHRDDEAVTESDARQPKTDHRGHAASDDTTTPRRRPAFLRGFSRDETPAEADADARRAEDTDERRRGAGLLGFRRDDTGRRRDEVAAGDARRRDARPRDERAAAAVAERDALAEREREERVHTHMKRWDTAGFLAAGAAVALAVFGGLALARAGVDDSWYSPVVQVARVDHTAALGAIEIGVAALVLIPLLFGLRMVAALVAIAGGVVAAVAAIDPEQVSADLALERGWAIGLAVTGIALGLLLVATRDRVKRVERRPARAERHRLAREAREARTA